MSLSFGQNYRRNKSRAVYEETMPSLADQSGANDTNINVIVKRYAQTGIVPGNTRSPMGGDFTSLPEDLRSMIETSRSLKETRKRLPEGLRDMPVEQLLTLTTDELTRILTPPKPQENGAADKTT